jgi:hypothetical protein
MSRLTAFFPSADNMFGVFYPKHHLLAVYPDEAAARAAGEKLREAGWDAESLLTASGEDVLQFAEEHLEKGGLTGLLMAELSRVIGTEAAYAEDDLRAAREGAGFLAAHCPTTEAKDRAWRVLATTAPVAARHYSGQAIELLGPATSRVAAV